jgi:hypothetical protein
MAQPRAARGLAVGDYDSDGRLDVLCVNRNERADLFRNVSPDSNHWVSIRLVGRNSNRDGAGAKVTLKSASIRQYAQCRLSSSYASSSDKRLFFGLGPTPKIDEIDVVWPSGTRDRHVNMPANKALVLTESEGWREAPPPGNR